MSSSRRAIFGALATSVLLVACAPDRVAAPSVPNSLGAHPGYYPPGNEGCTPGFWKTHADNLPGHWFGFIPTENVENIFDVPDVFGLDQVTLLEALSLPGGPGAQGGAQILLRAAVAANYPRTTADVIADVNAALASGDRDTMLDLAEELDVDNNLGCPL